MSSAIDPTKPTAVLALTSDVRANFAAAKAEIEALQSAGPFLELDDGGTVDGPIYITATGGTVPRSAQDRAADTANVLDFGADPTGVADSTAAFNAAIASRPFKNAEVFIPIGRYTLTDAVTLGAGCVIRGAGRQLTLIQINSSFNMSAQGVFVLGSDPSHAGTPTIKDLWIRFTQPNFAGMTRADLIHYPPAIYKAAATLTGRPNFENLMISSAWVGFYLDNCAAYIDNIYISAFSYGCQWSATTPTLDVCRVSNVHFWPFDMLSTSPVGLLMLDGTTNCAWFGRIDGLNLTNFFNESSIVTIDCGANPGGGYYYIANIGLDGHAQLIINSNVNLQLESITNSRSTSADYTAPGITINGGANAIYNAYLASAMPALPMILVQGGTLEYYGGTPCRAESDTPFMVCSAGVLAVRDTSFNQHSPTPRTTAVISQTGTGYVHVSGCRFALPTGSVSPVLITTSANAFVDANNYGGVPQTLPTDYQTISYGNRSIRGDASVPTAAQLTLRGLVAANSIESKLRFAGSFGTGTDYSQYLAASLRAAFTTSTWNTSYLDIYLTSVTNGTASDANMTRAARFTPTSITLDQPVTFSQPITGPVTTNNVLCDGTASTHNATNTFNVTIANGVNRYILTPAGTLASGTITMPAAPVQGQSITIPTTQTITSFTLNANAGQTIVGAPTTLAANTCVRFFYFGTTWYREA